MMEEIIFSDGTRADVTEYYSALLSERYYRVIHPSGLPIYFFPKKHTTVSALYATRFGAADLAFTVDGEEETVLPMGCAHFLEHKMFEEEDGSDAFERFSALGADANAYTSWDKTAYLFHTTEAFGECLSALLSFVSRPYFTKETVKKEQGIIAEEIRMNDDSPAERCFTNALRAIYSENAVRNEICGTEESIGRITPEILYRCCDVFYRPSSMALVVSGDVTLREIVSVVDGVLGALPTRGPAPRYTRRDENRGETRAVCMPRIEERMEVGKPMFVIAVKDHDAVLLSPDERMRRDALMTLIREMYFSTSSELYTRLLDEELVSPQFSAGYGATSLYAFFEIAGESDDPDRVLREILGAIREIREKGVDPDAFERARRVLYAKTVKSFDSTKTVSEMLLDFVLSDYELFRYVSLFDTLTCDDVAELIESSFCEESFALSVISPLSE